MQWVLDPTTMRSDFYDLRLKDGGGRLLWEKTFRTGLIWWYWTPGTFRLAHTPCASLTQICSPLPEGRTIWPTGWRRMLSRISSRGSSCPSSDTWQTQFNVWGFGQPLHPLWDADNLVEIFITAPPYALFDGTGTYHRSTHNGGQPYPQRRIWWYASNDAFQAYTTLADAYRAVFAHEFFHLMQWNVHALAQKPLTAGQVSAGRSPNRWITFSLRVRASSRRLYNSRD